MAQESREYIAKTPLCYLGLCSNYGDSQNPSMGAASTSNQFRFSDNPDDDARSDTFCTFDSLIPIAEQTLTIPRSSNMLDFVVETMAEQSKIEAEAIKVLVQVSAGIEFYDVACASEGRWKGQGRSKSASIDLDTFSAMLSEIGLGGVYGNFVTIEGLTLPPTTTAVSTEAPTPPHLHCKRCLRNSTSYTHTISINPSFKPLMLPHSFNNTTGVSSNDLHNFFQALFPSLNDRTATQPMDQLQLINTIRFTSPGSVLGQEAQRIKNFIPQQLLQGKEGYQLFLFIHRVIGRRDSGLRDKTSVPIDFADVPLEFIEFHGLPALLASKTPLAYFYTWLMSIDAHAILLFLFEHVTLCEMKEANSSTIKLKREYDRLIRVYLTDSSTLYMWNLSHYFHPDLEKTPKPEMLERMREAAFMTLGDYFMTFWHGKEPLMQNMCNEIGNGRELVTYTHLQLAFQKPLAMMQTVWKEFRNDNEIEDVDKTMDEDSAVSDAIHKMMNDMRLLTGFLGAVSGLGWDAFKKYKFLGQSVKHDHTILDEAVLDDNDPIICLARLAIVIAKEKAKEVTIHEKGDINHALNIQSTQARHQSTYSQLTDTTIKVELPCAVVHEDSPQSSPIYVTNQDTKKPSTTETNPHDAKTTISTVSAPSAPHLTIDDTSSISHQSAVSSNSQQSRSEGIRKKILGTIKQHRSRDMLRDSGKLLKTSRSRDNFRDIKTHKSKPRKSSLEIARSIEDKVDFLDDFFGLPEIPPPRLRNHRSSIDASRERFKHKNLKDLIGSPKLLNNLEGTSLTMRRESSSNMLRAVPVTLCGADESVRSGSSRNSNKRRMTIYRPGSSSKSSRPYVTSSNNRLSSMYELGEKEIADTNYPASPSPNFSKGSNGSTTSLPILPKISVPPLPYPMSPISLPYTFTDLSSLNVAQKGLHQSSLNSVSALSKFLNPRAPPCPPKAGPKSSTTSLRSEESMGKGKKWFGMQ